MIDIEADANCREGREEHLRSMEGVLVSHEHKNLVRSHRLAIGPVFAHVQLNNDGLEMLPPLLVRDVEELVVGRTGE